MQEGYILNSVARTRCGRISRPPRHVVRDYKRLKSLNESNNDVEDENENNGGYADYRVNDGTNPIIEMKNTEPVAESTLYGTTSVAFFGAAFRFSNAVCLFFYRSSGTEQTSIFLTIAMPYMR